MKNASITEIFSSIQGEGIYLGSPQIFVRFSGCNSDCLYCDEKHKSKSVYFSIQQLLEKIENLDKEYGPHHSVSLTGGEPLIHSEFLKIFLPRLKKKGFKIYLETNGTLPKALNGLKEQIDTIAMDIKLPSSTGQSGFWEDHKRFLVLGKKKSFVKVVITGKTDKKDLRKAVNIVKQIDPGIAFVLQPVTESGPVQAPALEDVIDMAALASKSLNDVRIIPQVHKMMGVG
jgi:organic radical activating enzyme